MASHCFVGRLVVVLIEQNGRQPRTDKPRFLLPVRLLLSRLAVDDAELVEREEEDDVTL